MTVYPNPAGNYFDIDIDKEKAGIDDLSRNIEYMLTITDNMGMVKYTDRVYEFPHRVNTRNLSNGVYIIRVVYEGNSYSARLVIDN
ncbi:MAG: T9SS type A sorting domain-containing protein [Cyclobacteriaceae bacterium]